MSPPECDLCGMVMNHNRPIPGSYVCRRTKHHQYFKGGYVPRHAGPFSLSHEHFMAWEASKHTPRHRA